MLTLNSQLFSFEKDMLGELGMTTTVELQTMFVSLKILSTTPISQYQAIAICMEQSIMEEVEMIKMCPVPFVGLLFTAVLS